MKDETISICCSGNINTNTIDGAGNKFQQVFIVNKDLEMGKGKIAAQIAHGEVYYMTMINVKIHECTTNYYPLESSKRFTEKYFRWMNNGVMKKIVLKASQKEIEDIVQNKLKDKYWFRIVRDLGLTQVEPNSLTCIVVEPLEEKLCKELFGDLKLL